MKLNKTKILNEIMKHKNHIKKYGVKRLGLFGSVVRNEETDNSDIDFLVEFTEGKKNFDTFMDLCFYLEELFKNKIDLVTPEALSENLKKSILNEVNYIEFG